jgi:hypothetical protein
MPKEPKQPGQDPLHDPPAPPLEDPPDKPMHDPAGDPTYEPQQPFGDPAPPPGQDPRPQNPEVNAGEVCEPRFYRPTISVARSGRDRGCQAAG